MLSAGRAEAGVWALGPAVGGVADSDLFVFTPGRFYPYGH